MVNNYKNWEIITTIGEGGQTHVYLVKDTRDSFKGEYVLKRLKNIERIDRFIREVETRKKLDHPQIPKVVDFDLEIDKPFFVEEYIEGGDLSKNRTLYENNIIKILQYFKSICEVVKYAHSQEVIHRDLKPENIIYNRNKDVFFITDFGICFDPNEERLTTLNEQVGSRNFIAPELQRGRAEDVNYECDIYSLGRLLYWMITGQNLYREALWDNEYDLVNITGEIEYERIIKLLSRMITEKPKDRYDSLFEIIKKLDNIIKSIEKNINIIFLDYPQKCIYCNIGKYVKVAYYNPSIHKDVQSGIAIVHDSFEKYGIVIKRKSEECWLLYKCTYCGNIQLFVFPKENLSWFDRRYPEPDF